LVFSGNENALFLSVSSRTTTCTHTAALRKALEASDVSAKTVFSRMRLHADAAEFSMCADYGGSSVLWSLLYHSFFSVVMFSSSNAAMCVARCCRRFRGRCGHVRVARDRLGLNSCNNVKFGTAPVAVKARADAHCVPPVVYDKMLNNEDEDKSLEKQASDTVRAPQDSAPMDMAARTSRNLLPCASEPDKGEVWNRTAD